jgi:hypothetical protein
VANEKFYFSCSGGRQAKPGGRRGGGGRAKPGGRLDPLHLDSLAREKGRHADQLWWRRVDQEKVLNHCERRE